MNMRQTRLKPISTALTKIGGFVCHSQCKMGLNPILARIAPRYDFWEKIIKNFKANSEQRLQRRLHPGLQQKLPNEEK
jgi:hypothetical protein